MYLCTLELNILIVFCVFLVTSHFGHEVIFEKLRSVSEDSFQKAALIHFIVFKGNSYCHYKPAFWYFML